MVGNVGERTPVRKRLETLVPSIWNLCDANSQMFTVIAKLQGQTIDSALKPVRLSRLVETEHGDGIQVTATPGSWYD
jgi:hypothetical protein